MELLSVRCNHCGAPLQIPAEARFVTCMYCKSELTVQRSDGAVCTEVLQRIEQKTDRMADNLGVLRIQGELELLDREWQMKREVMLIRDRRGKLVEPGGSSKLAGCAVGLFMVPFVMLFSIGSMFSSDKSIAPAIVLALVVGVVINIARKKKRSPYKVALEDYEKRRAGLLEQLAGQSQGK